MLTYALKWLLQDEVLIYFCKTTFFFKIKSIEEPEAGTIVL